MSLSTRKRSKHSSRSSQSQFPSPWSDWVYDENQDRYQRYRLKGPGQYEYDYQQPQSPAIEQARPRDPGPVGSIPAVHGSYTESSLYTTSNSPANPLDETFAELSMDPRAASTFASPAPVWQPPNVTARDPSTDREEFDPHYKVQKASQFRTGRIFKVLWSEPSGYGAGNTTAGSTGSIDSITVRSGKYGQKHHEKVRRFVITNPMSGHCICLPIMTYGGQGVNKRGVHADHHTIIYSIAPPVYLPGEELKLNKKPLLVEPVSPRHKLDPASRLNYAKPYTVEYNVKVWFIGKLVDDSYWQLAADYNLVHPPLPTRPAQDFQLSQTPRDTYSHATGGSGGTQYPFPSDSTPYASVQYPGQNAYVQSNQTNEEFSSWAEQSVSMPIATSMAPGYPLPNAYNTSNTTNTTNGGFPQWVENSGSSSNATSTPISIPPSNIAGPAGHFRVHDDLSPLPGEVSSSAYRSSYVPPEHDEDHSARHEPPVNEKYSDSEEEKSG